MKKAEKQINPLCVSRANWYDGSEGRIAEIGINYFGSDGGYYPASTWAITENALRRKTDFRQELDIRGELRI